MLTSVITQEIINQLKPDTTQLIINAISQIVFPIIGMVLVFFGKQITQAVEMSNYAPIVDKAIISAYSAKGIELANGNGDNKIKTEELVEFMFDYVKEYAPISLKKSKYRDSDLRKDIMIYIHDVSDVERGR